VFLKYYLKNIKLIRNKKFTVVSTSSLGFVYIGFNYKDTDNDGIANSVTIRFVIVTWFEIYFNLPKKYT